MLFSAQWKHMCKLPFYGNEPVASAKIIVDDRRPYMCLLEVVNLDLKSSAA